jgi:methionyl aminopeptidase
VRALPLTLCPTLPCCLAAIKQAQVAKQLAPEQPEGAGEDGEWLFCTHRGKGRNKKRPIYQWTGKLRPHPISPYRPVPDHIARPDYATTGWPADEMESKKQNVVHLHTPKEIEGIRAACQLVRARGVVANASACRVQRS